MFNLLVGLFFSLSALAQPSFLKEGLVAYYPFNGNANDDSGNGNNGTSVSTQLTQDRFGNSANALDFNGAGSSVVVPHSKSIAIQNDVTISVWKKGRTPTRNYENYITKRDGQGNWNYSLQGSFYYGPGGCPGEKDKYMTGRRNSGQMELKFTDTTVSESIGIWVNLVVSIRDKRATFFINGSPSGTSCFGSDFTLPSVDVGAPLTIGSFEGDWYNGALDDVRIYNRALSGTEVKALYDYESTPPDNSFITNGLVAYYPFNGNANDESGSGNNGAVQGALLIPDRNGDSNRAYDFDGKSQIVVPSSASLNLTSFSVSAWVKIQNPDRAFYQILTKGGDLDENYEILVYGNQLPPFGTIDTAVKWSDGTRGGYSGESPSKNYVKPSLWNHILVSYDKTSGYLNVYINREISFRAFVNKIPKINSTPLHIGSDPNMGRNHLGSIDDVRIYNRALSDGEVKALYDYESTPPDNSFITNGLVAYYPFNGNANDASGNGRDSSFVGTVKSSVNRFGKSGNAIFVGSTNYVHLPKDKAFSNPAATYTFWFQSEENILSDRPEDNFCIFLSAGPDHVPLWYINADYPYFSAKALTLCYWWGNGVGVSGLVALPYSIVPARWDQYAISVDGSEQTVYVNGTKVYNAANYFGNAAFPVLDIGNSAGNTTAIASARGSFDDVRIYNRALSNNEVKALYDYESAPPQNNLNPRTATATAQVVNGFVVGATITDAGYGYVSNPVVTIIGGGGTGAKATATQFNGVVTSITITNPGIGYTSVPIITIAPPPFPPRKATSTAQIVNGFVVGTKITDGGFGYDSPPAVLIIGGGGSGATAVATVANDVVTAITISNPGTGYTSAPVVRIASPPFAPKLGIETSKVYVRMSVVLGRKYQLEASTDLNTWTTTGPAFIAQDEELAQEFDVNQVGRYFRINQVP